MSYAALFEIIKDTYKAWKKISSASPTDSSIIYPCHLPSFLKQRFTMLKLFDAIGFNNKLFTYFC
jgi:hypothetical protein